MTTQRTQRVNSLLKEVLSDVIKRQVQNPHVSTLVTVTHVQVTKDLQHAKVFISVIGPQEAKTQTLRALQSAAGFIAIHASRQVVMRYFPALTFHLDTTVAQQMHIDSLLGQIQHEQQTRRSPTP